MEGAEEAGFGAAVAVVDGGGVEEGAEGGGAFWKEGGGVSVSVGKEIWGGYEGGGGRGRERERAS